MKTINQYEYINSKNFCICKKCNSSFTFKPDETWWIEHGSYSEKNIKCPECDCINVIKYVDGYNQNPNYDIRYFK